MCYAMMAPLQLQHDDNTALPQNGGGEQHQPKGTITSTAFSTPRRKSSKVQFHGVEIRAYARSLGDNPSAIGGPPLGLDWDYQDVTTTLLTTARTDTCTSSSDTGDGDVENGSGNTNTNTNTTTMIPIDDYEEETQQRRRSRINQFLKLQKQSQQQQQSQHSRIVQRCASTGDIYFKEYDTIKDDHNLSDEQMKQLNARWLRIQPIPGKTRQRMLLEETTTTLEQIKEMNRSSRKLRQQRQSTIAMMETGLDDWQSLGEFLTRRFRRLWTGISKKREQELLWEQAANVTAANKTTKVNAREASW